MSPEREKEMDALVGVLEYRARATPIPGPTSSAFSEAAKAIKDLRTENEALRAEEEQTAVDEEVAYQKLKAERDALLKDAERYRILRNREHGFLVEQERPGWITTLPMGKGLDEAIDAAMASSSKGGK